MPVGVINRLSKGMISLVKVHPEKPKRVLLDWDQMQEQINLTWSLILFQEVKKMDKKTMKQMAKMVDALQPHCEEEIVAAMTCSHAGSMSSGLISKLFGGFGGGAKSSNLPNPVFIAVGSKSIYAFDYAPRGFNFKIKKEVARWPRDEVSVVAENTGAMATFVLTTGSGESYHFEVPTMMGGRELVDVFFGAIGGSQE
ncbi:MAG: hypothetical protein WBF05_05555 [Anaerolineales bacterium]